MNSANNYKKLFELDNDITYLNCSSMSPLLKSVKEAGKQDLEKRSKPWKLTDKDWFQDAEVLRSKASKIFQTSEDNIAIVPSASYGLAAAAKNLRVKPGKSIIVIEDQFPSNYYVWDNLSKQLGLKIITVRKENNKLLTDSILESINSETGIVAIPNCHWIDGSLINLEKVSEAVKGIKGYLILDLSQSLGVLPANIDKIDPDFAVSVGYKWLLGPYSLSYLYISPRWQDNVEPLEYNWSTRKGSDNFSSLTIYTSEYRAGARKFDMGEFSQFNTMQMAIAALDQILKWEVENIQSSIKILTDIISENIGRNINYQKSLTPNAGHIISIPIGNKDVESLKKKFAENKIFVSFRGSSIRISPHLYNDGSDIERLMDCLY
jgi:selenocysteine lyase/cysteine desulfurase